MFNAHYDSIDFTIPGKQFGVSWKLIVDTTEATGYPAEAKHVHANGSITVPARSIIILRQIELPTAEADAEDHGTVDQKSVGEVSAPLNLTVMQPTQEPVAEPEPAADTEEQQEPKAEAEPEVKAEAETEAARNSRSRRNPSRRNRRNQQNRQNRQNQQNRRSLLSPRNLPLSRPSTSRKPRTRTRPPPSTNPTIIPPKNTYGDES